MSVKPVKLPRHTKGKRPAFFDDPAIDQVMTFLVELTAELSVVTDRLDSIQRLLQQKGTVTLQEIEAYRPDEAVATERMARRDTLLKRVFRMHKADPHA